MKIGWWVVGQLTQDFFDRRLTFCEWIKFSLETIWTIVRIFFINLRT